MEINYRAPTNPILQVIKQRPQKTLACTIYTWLGFFLVKYVCHKFTVLLPCQGHGLWGNNFHWSYRE